MPWSALGSLAVLAALPALPAQEPVPPIPSAESLQQEFDRALRSWADANNRARAAKDEGELERLRGTRPEPLFAQRFADAAQAFAGKEAAVPYLVWVVQRGPAAMATAAMTTLMETHVASPGLRLAVARIGGLKHVFGAERSLQWLDRVLAKNQDPHCLAQAHFTRAAMHVGTRAVATSEALRQEALGHLRAARAILDGLPKAEVRSLAGLVDALRDEAERLEPGLQAPEIEGVDLDGVAFKLSDYRGKVVLLDFWGDW
ncbi:MAG: hypothetical protein FJ265_03930 [Planctomycetes bacterium]|nr:hypothetical protein [Planctomycetota bacterium]